MLDSIIDAIGTYISMIIGEDLQGNKKYRVIVIVVSVLCILLVVSYIIYQLFKN
jgi:hypothetical protein